MPARCEQCVDCGRRRPDVAGWPQRCTDCSHAGDAWVFGLPAARLAMRRLEEDPEACVSDRVRKSYADAEERVLDLGSMSGQNLRYSLEGKDSHGKPCPMRAHLAASAAGLQVDGSGRSAAKGNPSARPADGGQTEFRFA